MTTIEKKNRITIPKPSDDPAHMAAELILMEQGYSRDEARIGLQYWRKGDPCNRENIRWLVSTAKEFIELHRDELRVGTDLYQGVAYFWAHKYRHWMRGNDYTNNKIHYDPTGSDGFLRNKPNGYRGVPIKKARRIIHGRFLDDGLDLAGETERHDEIINEVFGINSYTQEIENNERI